MPRGGTKKTSNKKQKKRNPDIILLTLCDYIGEPFLIPCRAFVPTASSQLLSPHSKYVCVIIVCACVHRAWCFESFVDVNILGAGDNLLSSAAGKARYYAQLKSFR